MKQEIIKCNNCKKITEDIYKEIGWITIDFPDGCISITGGRTKDGPADTFRYINNIKELHFCCAKCLLNFLYLKDGYFNTHSVKTFHEKLNTIQDEDRRDAIKNIIIDIFPE